MPVICAGQLEITVLRRRTEGLWFWTNPQDAGESRHVRPMEAREARESPAQVPIPVQAPGPVS